MNKFFYAQKSSNANLLLIVCILPVIFFPSLLCGQSTGGKKAHDQQRIQGTWQVAHSADDGRVAPPETIESMRFVFDGDKLEMKGGPRETKGTFKLDPSTSPKSIDLTENGGTVLGIYELEGDTLRLSIAEGSHKARPTEFAGENGNDDLLIVLKRQLPPVKRENLKGEWRVESHTYADGTSPEYWKGVPVKFELAKKQILVKYFIGEKHDQEVLSVRLLDSSKNPAWFDSDDAEGDKGICKIENDQLTICMGKTRPTSFDSTNNVTTLVLRRWKKGE